MTRNVLIVKDHPSLGKDMVRYFRIWFKDQVSVTLADSILDAQTYFEKSPLGFDLIVMDACVPGHVPNTIPLVHLMRETFIGPIIACSSEQEYAEQLIAAGCTEACPKLRFSEAKEVMRKRLGL